MARSMTPFGALIRGVLAGAAGTAAMDAVWYARYRRDGGEDPFLAWEFSSGMDWDSAPAPAQVGRRVAEGFLQRELPASAAAPMNNAVHWATGLGWGAMFGLLAGSRRSPRLRSGIRLGVTAWAAGYAVLPLAGLYEPMWKYDPKTLWKDLSAHLAFGTGTAAAFRLLSLGKTRRRTDPDEE